MILTFCRYKKDLAVHVQMDNQAALAYLVKMGGTRNLFMIQEAKEIWEFCLAIKITLIAEYLPGTLHTRADKASREMKNSSWTLTKPIFQKLIQALGPVHVDLLASRLCHQIPKYISWQPDPHAWMVDAFQVNWKPKSIRLPTFCSYTESVRQSNVGQVYKLIIITPV